MSKILDEYDERKFSINSMENALNRLIPSLLDESRVKFHQITTRVKDRKSLERKIEKKGDKYNCLDDITDIIGVRIVTYFEDEVDIIANIIKKEFDIDEENSIDKRKVDDDRFGYRSLHYVASFNNDRTNLTEYSNCKGLKFELQIRSILQHSWAEIEHGLGYKGVNEIPASARRTFYRTAALLEQADIEFVKLKETIKEYEGNLKNSIELNPDAVEINKASLLQFLNSKEVVAFENKIFNNLDLKVIESFNWVESSYIEKLSEYGIKDIGKLKKIYFENSEAIQLFDDRIRPSRSSPMYISRGATLLWLINFIIPKKTMEDYKANF